MAVHLTDYFASYVGQVMSPTPSAFYPKIQNFYQPWAHYQPVSKRSYASELYPKYESAPAH